MVLLMVHAVLTPVIASLASGNAGIAGMLTFITVLAFWSMNYIAAEIEQPFGEDFNDLPIPAMLKDMNRSLSTLLMKPAQQPPKFTFDPDFIQPFGASISCEDAEFRSTK